VFKPAHPLKNQVDNPILPACLPANGCGFFETAPGVQNPRVEAGLSDTLWSLRTVPITPLRSETQQSTPPRGIEKLRGQIDRTGGDCLGGRLRPTGKYRARAAGKNSAANKRQWTQIYSRKVDEDALTSRRVLGCTFEVSKVL